jgi:hypothetical protein
MREIGFGRLDSSSGLSSLSETLFGQTAAMVVACSGGRLRFGDVYVQARVLNSALVCSSVAAKIIDRDIYLNIYTDLPGVGKRALADDRQEQTELLANASCFLQSGGIRQRA